jgi:hypothetical protein
MYTLLLAFSPVIFYLLNAGHTWQVLAGSFATWAVAQQFPNQAPFPWAVTGSSFPVASWQLLLVVGIVAGHHLRSVYSRLNSRIVVLSAAGGILVLNWSVSTYGDLPLPALFGDATYGSLFQKEGLGPGRILAFLDREDHSKDEGLAYIGPGLRKTYDWRIERAAKATRAQVAARHKEHELSMKILPMLQAAGIPILAGTDAGYLNSFNYPGEGLHDEIELYVKAGLSPQQALASSVLTGPKFLGHADRYGSVAPGKAADLLILDANPLQSVAATRKISAVVLRGRLIDRKALDRLLADAKIRAAPIRLQAETN